jgi:hypothetical protein
MAKRFLPSQEALRQLMDYDAETGVLTWRSRPLEAFNKGKRQKNAQKIWNSRFAGTPALAVSHGNGYCSGALFKVKAYAHRVVWKWVHGTEPDQIDHINGNRSDNRICNLRSVHKAENAKNTKLPKNNTSGHIGVSFRKTEQKWEAYLGDGGGKIRLGVFSEKSDAIAARLNASFQFGYHTNHGRNHGNN